MPDRPVATTTSTDGAAIYDESFATIRREARFDHLPADAERVAVRMVHGTGQVDLADDLVIHPRLVSAAREALEAGAPIITDAHMVATGVTRARLPRDNEVLCALRRPAYARPRDADGHHPLGRRALAARRAASKAPSSRSATPPPRSSTCSRCCSTARRDRPRSSAYPVGFIGAAESKQALEEVARHLDIPFLTVRGRRGGSAMAASALNALAQERE